MRWNRLALVGVVALLVSMKTHAQSCENKCVNEDRADLYYCQDPNQGIKREHAQQQKCQSATVYVKTCTGISETPNDVLDYTDYDGYAITSGSAGWYCIVSGQVTYCGASQCQNGEHCVEYSGTGCVAVTWGGTPHDGLIYCLE